VNRADIGQSTRKSVDANAAVSIATAPSDGKWDIVEMTPASSPTAIWTTMNRSKTRSSTILHKKDKPMFRGKALPFDASASYGHGVAVLTAALLAAAGWIPVAGASADDAEGRETRQDAAPPAEGEWPTDEEVQALADRMAKLLSRNAPRAELERAGRELADHVKYRFEPETRRILGVTPTAYVRSLIRAGAQFPDAHVWRIAARGSYGARRVSDEVLLAAALPLFDPHVDGGESLMAYQVLGYIAGGYDAPADWDKGALRNWSEFEEWLDTRLRTRQAADREDEAVSDGEVVALLFFLIRADPQRALELFITPGGALLPGVAGEEGRAERQRIATLLRAVDTMIWKQRHRFIDDEQATPEAREAIAALAGSDYWWVRLAALHLMFREPELFQMEVFQELTRDTQERLRRETGVVKRLVQKKSVLVHENLRPLREDDDEVLDVGE
jgi:hypothetical protein